MSSLSDHAIHTLADDLESLSKSSQIQSRKTTNEFLTAFKQFDLDGDGSISSEEMRSVLRRIRAHLHPFDAEEVLDRLGISDAEVEKMMNEADTNKDGRIDFKEFLTIMSRQVEVIRGIGKKMLEKEKSIRHVFKQLDPNYYGYLTVQKFRTLLDDPSLGITDVTPQEKDLIVAYCDVSDESDGKIDYREFFRTFFKWHIKKSLQEKTKSTLKQVFVITRHGTRFPLTPMPLNASWPSHPDFWKSYGGKLTPKGIKEHTHIGAMLAARYTSLLRLIPDDDNFSNEVYVFTSNTDRTLLSASGFLTGFCPDVSHTFAVEGDTKGQKFQGVPIHVADPSRKNTPVVHGYIGHNKYIVGKDKAAKSCPLFAELLASRKPELESLFSKLWEMTEHERIPPTKPLLARLAGVSPIHQQIEIERSLKMNVLSNTKGVSLNAQDEDLMEEIANIGKRVKFQGNNNAEQLELGRAAAGLLPSHIIKSFRERVETIVNPATMGQNKRKFALYSAHDYTIMALLSHLGFRDWPIPKFASHLVFELHMVEGVPRVRMAFNPNPSYVKGQEAYEYKSPPLDSSSINWAEAKDGMISLDDFENMMMKVRRSFTSEEEWKADGDSVELPAGMKAGGDD